MDEFQPLWVYLSNRHEKTELQKLQMAPWGAYFCSASPSASSDYGHKWPPVVVAGPVQARVLGQRARMYSIKYLV